MVRYTQVQELVGNHEILETWLPIGQIISQTNDAGGRAGTPFPFHVLYADDSWLSFQLVRPVLHPLTQPLAPSLMTHWVHRRVGY